MKISYSIHNKLGDAHYPFGLVVRVHRGFLDEEEIGSFKHIEDARSFIEIKKKEDEKLHEPTD